MRTCSRVVNIGFRGIAIPGDEPGHISSRKPRQASRGHLAFGVLVLCTLATSAARADIDPVSGIDFVRVNVAGNAPWMGDPRFPNDGCIGCGTVDHPYSIGKYEVTTAQWTEFFNAAFDRPASDRLPHLIPPTFWGAVSTSPTTPGGQRWSVPAGNEMRAVGNISWRMAAVYCNWLHNGKGTDRSAFMSGAYDVSTFGFGPMGLTDQLTHDVNARYWIPTRNEWMTAVHYDPNKNGPGDGGWWLAPNGTDVPPAYGPPGQRVHVGSGAPRPDPNGPVAQANSGWDETQFLGFNPFTVPLGAYPDVQSPWGLLDVAGGTSEWTEEAFGDGVYPQYREFDGSCWASSPGNTSVDRPGVIGGNFPQLSTLTLGLRVASSVPGPSTSAVCFGCIILMARRNR